MLNISPKAHEFQHYVSPQFAAAPDFFPAIAPTVAGESICWLNPSCEDCCLGLQGFAINVSNLIRNARIRN